MASFSFILVVAFSLGIVAVEPNYDLDTLLILRFNADRAKKPLEFFVGTFTKDSNVVTITVGTVFMEWAEQNLFDTAEKSLQNFESLVKGKVVQVGSTKEKIGFINMRYGLVDGKGRVTCLYYQYDLNGNFPLRMDVPTTGPPGAICGFFEGTFLKGSNAVTIEVNPRHSEWNKQGNTSQERALDALKRYADGVVHVVLEEGITYVRFLDKTYHGNYPRLTCIYEKNFKD